MFIAFRILNRIFLWIILNVMHYIQKLPNRINTQFTSILIKWLINQYSSVDVTPQAICWLFYSCSFSLRMFSGRKTARKGCSTRHTCTHQASRGKVTTRFKCFPTVISSCRAITSSSASRESGATESTSKWRRMRNSFLRTDSTYAWLPKNVAMLAFGM